MVEDFSGIPAFEGMARNAIQNQARIAAYRVIQRSNAWSRLLAQHLPHAVRLSIHPQLRVSEKIGIRLVAGDDGWATPWHSVVLKQGERVSLVPRARAEQLNAALIFRNGRPSHFELPELAA
jgi:L-tyrosine isonitrile synthase